MLQKFTRWLYELRFSFAGPYLASAAVACAILSGVYWLAGGSTLSVPERVDLYGIGEVRSSVGIATFISFVAFALATHRNRGPWLFGNPYPYLIVFLAALAAMVGATVSVTLGLVVYIPLGGLLVLGYLLARRESLSGEPLTLSGAPEAIVAVGKELADSRVAGIKLSSRWVAAAAMGAAPGYFWLFFSVVQLNFSPPFAFLCLAVATVVLAGAIEAFSGREKGGVVVGS